MIYGELVHRVKGGEGRVFPLPRVTGSEVV